MKIRVSMACLAVGALALTACEQEQAPAPVEKKPVETTQAPPPKPPEPTSHPDCVGPMTAGTPTEVKVGNVTWERNGATLTWKAPEKLDKLTLGVVTDIKENTEENLANLKAFVAWFQKSKVDMIVVAGDTGENAEQIESALSALAEAKVPVFNIAGNREGKAAYKAGMMAVAAKFPHVFDLNQVRRIDTPVADLVSMPGYFNRDYIHSEDGCQYYAKDVEAAAAIVKSANSPVILVSHGGPKQTGAEGIDRTAEGANVGDPMLTKLITDNKIPFGLFGNIHEAGGRGVDLEGNKVIAPKTMSEQLYVNPGPGDAVRWVMNDKTESVGMAALMTVKDGKASYEVMRAPDPEKKMAKAGKGKAK